jgi:hypothetical protein
MVNTVVGVQNGDWNQVGWQNSKAQQHQTKIESLCQITLTG